MPYLVKAALDEATAGPDLKFTEKTMYGGKKIATGDEIFIFASDHHGGRGLYAKGIITSVQPGPNIRLTISVRVEALARRRLGREQLKPFRELNDGAPRTELARNFYRQATNKIGGISEAATAFLKTYF